MKSNFKESNKMFFAHHSPCLEAALSYFYNGSPFCSWPCLRNNSEARALSRTTNGLDSSLSDNHDLRRFTQKWYNLLLVSTEHKASQNFPFLSQLCFLLWIVCAIPVMQVSSLHLESAAINNSLSKGLLGRCMGSIYLADMLLQEVVWRSKTASCFFMQKGRLLCGVKSGSFPWPQNDAPRKINVGCNVSPHGLQSTVCPWVLMKVFSCWWARSLWICWCSVAGVP